MYPPWGNFDGFTKIARMPGNPAKNNNFIKMQNYQKKGWTKTKVFAPVKPIKSA
ncbi:MAG: hypothetical protein ACLRFI_01475 [Alphaproteobacteria bacterium]